MPQMRKYDRFCAFAPKRGRIKEMVLVCAPLSERSCSNSDHHFSPRGCSAPALPRATDRKTAPHVFAEGKPRALVSARKAVMS